MRKKRSILPFGGSVTDGGVDEDGAETGADEGEFLGGVVGSVVGVNGFGDASFVKGLLEAFDEVFCVVAVFFVEGDEVARYEISNRPSQNP